MRPALRPSILVGQDRAHESARSQHPSVHSHSRVPSLPWQARAHSLVRLGLRRGGGARPHRARAPRVDRRERRRQLAQLRGNVDGAAQVSTSHPRHTTTHWSEHAGTPVRWHVPLFYRLFEYKLHLHIAAPRLHTEICPPPAPHLQLLLHRLRLHSPSATTPALHLHRLLHLHRPASCSRAFGAILHKTEMQLRYFPSNSSITDMSISLAGVALHVETNTLLAPSQTAFPVTVYLSGAGCVGAKEHASG